MSASTSFPPKMPHTGVTFDGTTPIVSNKKHLNSEHMKRSGTTITSNRTASTASTTSSLSSISSATASQFSTATPSIQFSPESSFHPGSAQRSMQTSFFPKTHKMVLRSPQSVIYTNDRLPHRTRKTKSSHNEYKKIHSSLLRSISCLISLSKHAEWIDVPVKSLMASMKRNQF